MPTECETRSYLRLILLYCMLGVSTLLVFGAVSFFFYKFFTSLSKNDRKQPLNMMSGTICILIVCERMIRLPETHLKYYGDRTSAFILDLTGNICHVIFVFLTLYQQVYRLDLAFKDSVYSMPNSEQNLLVGLVGVSMSAMIAFLAMSPFEGQNGIQIGSSVIAFIGIVAALSTLFRVNFQFGDKLQKIVAIHTAHQARRVQRLNTLSSIDNGSERGNGSQSLPDHIHDPPNEVAFSPRAVSAFARSSSVSDFDRSQQSILRTAARGTVLSAWITLSVLFLFSAIPLLIMSECLSLSTMVGNLMISNHCSILAICMFLSLKTSQLEYQTICNCCDKFAADLSATLTQRKVNRLALKHNDSSGINNA